jgi:hypothetical protein
MCITNFFFMLPPPTERPDDLVLVEYPCQRTSLSERTILEGKAGTKSLLQLRIDSHPSRWRRGDVDNWVKEAGQRKKKEAGNQLKRRAGKGLIRRKPRKG